MKKADATKIARVTETLVKEIERENQLLEQLKKRTLEAAEVIIKRLEKAHEKWVEQVDELNDEFDLMPPTFEVNADLCDGIDGEFQDEVTAYEEMIAELGTFREEAEAWEEPDEDDEEEEDEDDEDDDLEDEDE